MSQDATENQAQTITAVFRAKVRSGKRDEFEAWLRGVGDEIREARGFDGVTVIRPQPGSEPDYSVVVRFRTEEDLAIWESSEVNRI